MCFFLADKNGTWYSGAHRWEPLTLEPLQLPISLPLGPHIAWTVSGVFLESPGLYGMTTIPDLQQITVFPRKQAVQS